MRHRRLQIVHQTIIRPPKSSYNVYHNHRSDRERLKGLNLAKRYIIPLILIPLSIVSRIEFEVKLDVKHLVYIKATFSVHL